MGMAFDSVLSMIESPSQRGVVSERVRGEPPSQYSTLGMRSGTNSGRATPKRSKMYSVCGFTAPARAARAVSMPRERLSSA
jgi:hypothetical protein